ncbi:SRPBCC domain-containing protein [Siminovitchia terrae]|nr:SRPBCC family protein [Siminovitchia terrae]GIN89306.1 SRPBCC domain-containing protein [Siminovitchia terrae]
MKIYTMENSLTVKTPIEDVWEFFSDPKNLSILTPPKLKLQFMQEPPFSMFKGQRVFYCISPFPGLRLRWEGEIIEVAELERFIDEQRKGPFTYWRHEHLFFRKEEGTEIRDHLQYALPFGLIGFAIHPIVNSKMKEMFAYRNEKVKEVFPS